MPGKARTRTRRSILGAVAAAGIAGLGLVGIRRKDTAASPGTGLTLDAYVGEVRLFAGNFAPRGWRLCNGQLLLISQYTRLFSILGTTYGGNGTTSFALPDLRSRVPVGAGNGTGLSNYELGVRRGQESVTLGVAQLPSHTHTLMASDDPASANDPKGRILALTSTSPDIDIYDGKYDNLVAMDRDAISSTGGGQPVPVLQPSLALNYIICLDGVYPSRD